MHTKFTIIIPTRERCDTLKSTLSTCTSQDYENLTIIVSDNHSNDETKNVVDSFHDDRIKYINTGKRISMSDNWEFALSHVNDGYVMYLGDDDGLLPGTLPRLDKIINDVNCEAVTWKSADYVWPDCIIDYKKNHLTIPLRQNSELRDAKKILGDVVKFNRHYDELPTLYKGMVSYSAISRVMQESGKFFHSMSPDIYSGIALACVINTYYYSFRPYTLNGASRHSGGTAAFSSEADKQAEEKFFTEKNIPFHNKLILWPSFPIIVAESAYQAQDHLPCAKQIDIDILEVLRAAIRQASYTSRREYDDLVDVVKRTAKQAALEHELPHIILPYRKSSRRATKHILGVNIFHKNIRLDCTCFNVRNVHEASMLCENILSMKNTGYYSYSIPGILKTTLGFMKRELERRLGL